MDLCSFFLLSAFIPLYPKNSRPSIKILCSAFLYFLVFFSPSPLSFLPPCAASGLAGRPTAVHTDGENSAALCPQQMVVRTCVGSSPLQWKRRSAKRARCRCPARSSHRRCRLEAGQSHCLECFVCKGSWQLRSSVFPTCPCVRGNRGVCGESELRLCQLSSRCPGSREE